MAEANSVLERISKHEAWEIAKPWLEKAALVTGTKSIYDVPEYFREKLELKGLKIGKKEFGGGLAGATSDLLEKNKASIEKDGVSRKDIYAKITELENSGQTDTKEYKDLERELEETRSTAVKEAIEKVNKKLALTKEGEVKNSDARKEMARILREQRKAKQINKEVVTNEVKNTLDTYTNQKVDGVTATREALRSALTVTGTRQFMALGNIALDGANFVKQASQKAQQDGQDFDVDFLVKNIAEGAKEQWDELKGIIGKSDGTEGFESKSNVMTKLAEKASKYGVDTEGLQSVKQLATPLVQSVDSRFKKFNNPVSPDSESTQNNPTETSSVGFTDSNAVSTPVSNPNSNISASPNSTQSSNTTTSQNSPPVVFKPIPPPVKKVDEPDEQPENKTSVPSKNERITSADRSHLNKPFFEKSATNRVGRVTVDEKFSEGYAKSGLRPSYESVDPRVKNVRVREKYADTEAVDGSNKRTSRVAAIKQRRREASAPGERFAKRQYTRSKIAAKKLTKGKTNLKDRRLASAINSGLMSWNVPGWLFFQLPFAILNIAFFGLAFIYTEIFGIETSVDEVAEAEAGIFGFFSDLWEGISSTLLEAVTSLTGFDLVAFFNALNPINLFMMTLMLIMTYGLIILFVTALIYKFAGFKPLSGKGGGLKVGAFLLCIAGYSLPILNLFPWIIVWTATVWINPK